MSSTATGLDRAAQAMLRTLGAGSAQLLLPQPATATEQSGLGLVAPLASEVELAPVLLRTTGSNAAGNRQKLFAVMTRRTIQSALNNAGAVAGDAAATRQTLGASTLRMSETDYRIVSVVVKWISGTELLYELEIEE